MNKRIKPKSGETLVEVVASIFIFLIMIIHALLNNHFPYLT